MLNNGEFYFKGNLTGEVCYEWSDQKGVWLTQSEVLDGYVLVCKGSGACDYLCPVSRKIVIKVNKPPSGKK